MPALTFRLDGKSEYWSCAMRTTTYQLLTLVLAIGAPLIACVCFRASDVEEMLELTGATGKISAKKESRVKKMPEKSVTRGGEVKIVPEILDLTLKRDQPFAVRFDDPNWRQYRSCLMPLAENALVNSCILQGLHTRMLDHMLAISERTPRTVAVPNHRCLCYLARLIGLEECALRRFSLTTTKTLGVYKRDCGEVPLPGSSKRRTALENAFLTVTRDAQTLHHHVMSQGTADLLLSACSHVWAGDAVEPLTRVARKRVVDFCQRHCMTGYCSVMTYKTCGCNLSEQMSRRYIDLYFSFGRVSDSHAPVALPRSLSIDAASLPYFYSELPLHNTEQCLNVLLKDQVFCGVVVMQYQAREDVVHLIEQLDNACVRFVYFSKENELRSRVFAEKLGLEAGWNCHISLASKGSDEWEREQFERSVQDSKRNCSSGKGKMAQ
ncbi:unnamed protein product [Toxocara canis]|uniref:Uncharacterized protein n=1 Tax=Toxocara canis TaxID=6265 RepID=A0A183V5R4_TOXCA|nr:unnamed protein product [Toxocara canis]